MSELTAAAGFNHPSREELSAYKHGDLLSGEATFIEQHIRSCDHCQGILGMEIPQENLVLSSQPGSLEPALAAVPAAGDEKEPVQPGSPAVPHRRVIPWMPVLLALAVVIGAVLAWLDVTQASQLRSLQQMQQTFQRIIHNNQVSLAVVSQPGLRVVEFSGSEGAGNLVLSPDGKTAAVFLQKMLALDADHMYQVWLVPASGSPQSAGLFMARPGQPYVPHVINSAKPLADFKSIEIKVEPKSGSPLPTTAPILSAQL